MIGKSSSGAILSKSSTLVEQTGNEMPRFIKDIDLGPGSSGSINSEGLPNKGCDYYISDEALESLSKFKKPYIVSISGLKLEDNGEMIKRVLAQRKKHNGTGIDGVELNLACPNIPGKPTQAYDFEQMDKSLSYMTDILRASGDRITFGIKLAPYFDKSHCATAADIILQHADCVSYITTCNTIGNALFVDTDKECVSFPANGGYGGLAGGYIKQVALANVNTFHEMFTTRGAAIDIVGVGGVSTGDDAFQMILCGASAVQVGSTHWVEGATCFERISKELIHLIRSKGYSSIEDFKGKLRVYEKHNSKVPQSKSNSSSSSSAAINSNQDRSLKPIVVVVLVVAPFALLLGVLLGFYFHGDVSTLCTEFGKGFVEGYKV